MQQVLIANRGEIAVRIARACADLDIACVAVHARDEPPPPKLRSARLVTLPGAGARAYLDVAAIIAAALETGCDAIHPGYGFLSENAELAQACLDAGIEFVGPSPAVLRTFGDKSAARLLARQHGVPVPEGTDGPVDLAAAHAFRQTLPGAATVVVKALAGGGGRGMRIVRADEDLRVAFERCRAEAQAAFGSDALYVEAFIEHARHIEVQIAGDGSGAVVDFGERECSLQRRQQKLLEIAPSPSLRAEQRERVIGLASRLARAVQYGGLGTFEFLFDATRDAFVFIEANPRLQVEHTVTEQVWGVDLVQLQLRLAGGATLASLPALSTTPRGCALQLRVNAESMQSDGSVHGSAGTLRDYQVPSGPGIRVDDFLVRGAQLHPGFDSLLAKVIVEQADGDHLRLLKRADRALADFVVDGLATNVDFLRAILSHPELEADQVHTRWVDEHVRELLERQGRRVERGASDSGGSGGGGDSDSDSGGDDERGGDHASDHLCVTSPMHGVLAAIEVAAGDLVAAGHTVAIIEAMKMQHVVVATNGGRVDRIVAQVGDVVARAAPLLWLSESDTDDATPVAASAEWDPDSIRADLAELQARQALTSDAQRSDAVAKRHRQGGRTARENVDDLCDAGSFIEYGGLAVAAQRTRHGVEQLRRTTPADGVITGLGTINAEQFGAQSASCAVIAYDYTVLAGTQGFIGHAKQDRLLDVAHQLRRPLVVFAEGGGGRPGDSDEDHRVVAGLHLSTFRAFASLSGSVPLLAIVHGRCFAGNAALAGCCDTIIATRSTSLGMGGPAMIEGGGLGVVAADQVGPVSVQAPNGVIDVLVDDEAHAVRVARQYLAYFQGRLPHWTCADQRELRRAIPENRLRVYDIRALIATLVDRDSMLELRSAYGAGMITALVRIEGRALGLIANNPAHLGGAIDAVGSDKASRFLQLCDAFGLPVVSLCDTPGFMVGPAMEREAMVRRCCRLFVTGANLDVPLVSIVLRKGYGLGAMAMAGGGFHAPLATVAWPSGEFGGMGLEGAVRLGFRNELAAIGDLAERDAEFRRRVAALYERGKALNAAALLEIDNVIDPAATRHWILRLLDSVPPRQPLSGKRRPHVDTW